MNELTFMRWVIVAFLWAATVLGAWAQGAYGQWFHYDPQGSVNTGGIHREVMSRCPEYGLRQIRNTDKATQCHEATHFVNSEISGTFGQGFGAFYTGDGKCYFVPAPLATTGEVAKHVPQEQRTERYTHYLQGQMYVGRNCLSILDEWTCYANDAQCTRELGLREDGGLMRARDFSNFAAVLLQVVESQEPDYAGLRQLREFVAWQTARVAAMAAEHSVLVKAAADPAPVDLPPAWRELNTDGSCVNCSTRNAMRHLNLFDKANRYKYRGGETPSSHRPQLDSVGVRYAMTTDGDVDLLEYAIKNRRMAGITWSPAHMINFNGRQNGQAVLMGNGPRGIKEYHHQDWDEFLREWRERQDGWAFVILDGVPPPPTPD